MARFEAGLYRNAAGQCWMIWAKEEKDKTHPIAQQIWFDGNLNWEDFLGQAKQHFNVDSWDIERYGN